MENFNLSFPIDMIKKEQRIVSGIATADNVDKSGDIVDFKASMDAFKNWGGNIREMHAPIAVGKAIKYEPIQVKSEDGTIYNAFRVEAYISKGAESTWQKVLDGTLRAFSIGGKIVKKEIMDNKFFNGRPVNVIKQYELGELSLVDNPANALAVVDLVKINQDGGLDYVLDCNDPKNSCKEECSIEKKETLKDPKGGLTAAGRAHFNAQNGGNLKPGVKGPADTPEKMRRKGSFLTRFFTNPSGPMKKPNGEPSRLALSAAAWGEPVPQNAQDAAELAAKGRRLLERYAKLKNKSIDDIIEEDSYLLLKEIVYFMSDEYIEDFEKNCDCDCNGCSDCVEKTIDEFIEQNPDVAEKSLEEMFKSLTDWFGENWVDISRPKKGGGFEPCGRADASSGKYPKCVPASKASKMTAEQIASAVNRKRKAESSRSRNDKKPINVSTEVKKESKNVPTNPELYARVKAEAKAKFDVYPSAYANAWLVAEYKRRGGGYRVVKDAGATTTGSMSEAGIKNPTQGSFKTPTNPQSKKKKINIYKEILKYLQNDVEYDNVKPMDNIDIDKKVSLVKKFISWLALESDEETGLLKSENDTEASEEAEVNKEQLEEEQMDMEVLKSVLGSVIDEKLTAFATSFKEEVETGVAAKIDEVTKGFEIEKAETAQKLEAAEQVMQEQSAKIEQFAQAGAVKKSVDPEDPDDDEAIIAKSAPVSFWNNIYLPQGLINSLGYRS